MYVSDKVIRILISLVTIRDLALCFKEKTGKLELRYKD